MHAALPQIDRSWEMQVIGEPFEANAVVVYLRKEVSDE
jgi:hypothetical protein